MEGEGLKDIFVNLLSQIWERIVAFVPNFFTALVILLVGYIISKIVMKVTSSLLGKIGFDKLCEKVGLTSGVESAGIVLQPSKIIGKIVFWLIMLTFMVSGAETLGLDKVSQAMDAFVSYLPKVLSAAIIAFIGVLVAQFIRDLIHSASESIGIEYGKALSNLAYGALMVIILILAIGQLEIETTLLNRVVEIVLMAMGIAIALSLGLGGRNVAGNIVSGVYIREMFEGGESVDVDGERGTLEEIGTVATRIRKENGETVQVSNSRLIASKIKIHE